jgi:hypothetical protein
MIFFNTNSTASKSISFFLAFVLIFNSFLLIGVLNAQPARAILGAGDVVFDPAALAQSVKNFVVDKAKWAWDKIQAGATKAYQTISTAFDAWKKSDSILSKVSYALMYITINIMLTRMTQNIVGWLDGGAKGSPKIFQDFGQDFEDAADLAGGAVIGGLLGLNNGELCDPNFLKVRLTIGLDELRAPTFAEKFKCSFTGGIKNLKAFKDDFQAGGWRSWVQLGRSENNNLGGYLTAQREIREEQIKKTREVQAQIVSGSGLKPQQVCRITKGLAYVDELGFTGTKESSKDTSVRGRLSLGSKMKDVMGDYGYSNLAEFKSFWKFRGGDFACKIETPASAIAELSSKILTAPFDGLNDSLQAAATNLGKDAPAIFRPYLNAITTSAINLLIRKEKGLVSGIFDRGKTRNFKRQSSDIFKRTTTDTLSNKKLLGSAMTLRDQLLQSMLDFSLFSGTLASFLEKKSILLQRPILVSELSHKGILWSTGFDSGAANIWLPSKDNKPYPQDPTKGTSSKQDLEIAERTKKVVDGKSANGFPTLPIAGTMNMAGEVCGAFTQKSDSPRLSDASYEISKHIGYVALAPIGTTTKIGDIYDGGTTEGFFNNISAFDGYFGAVPTYKNSRVRIITFSDAGLFDKDGNPIPDRFVRENLTTGKITTFIDNGYGINEITVGPVPTTPDPQIIYTGELAKIGSQDSKVQSKMASTGDPNNTSGSIYYIDGNSNPAYLVGGSNWSLLKSDSFSGPSRSYQGSGYRSVRLPNPITGIRIQTNGSDGGACTVTLPFSFTGGVGHRNSYVSMALSGVFSQNISGGGGGNATADFVFSSVPDGTVGIGTPKASVKAAGLTRVTGGIDLYYYIAFYDRSDKCRVEILTGDGPDFLGIPAYTREAPYNIKYFSPILEGATASIENKKREMVYMDFLTSGTSATIESYLDLVNKGDEPVSLKDGAHKDSTENLNPFKMKMLQFFPEVSELQDEFITKMRVLTGYTQKGEKSNLSSLAEQIGAIPDDDQKYLSVSDVLIKYDDLSNLYQDLFIGISSEETLEGLDPDYSILNPTETNIKLSLIGQRCPTVPPSATSTPELLKGCGDFEPTRFYTAADKLAGKIPRGLSVGDPVPGSGEYNMAKKFVFKEDNKTGFTTNPFTGSRSSVLAGILNIDEMTQQLTTLPPDSNIIKLLRLRQILEQLQVTPKEITIPGKTTIIKPNPLFGVDLIQVDLRNYPEIEEFLNTTATVNIGTAANPVIVPEFPDDGNPNTGDPYATAKKLVELYGFTSAKEAYPQISTDIDNIFPEIITQVQDKLKEVFLKRIELELERARLTAQKRLLDFIYFAEDLSPAIQVQVPKNFVSFGEGVEMKLSKEVDTVVVRVVSSELAKSISDGGLAMIPSDDNCMSLSGEKINILDGGTSCKDNPEFDLRGFKVLPWDGFSTNSVMDLRKGTPSDSETVVKAVSIRKFIMAGIRKKIEKFNKMMGVNVNSIEFKDSLQNYILTQNEKGEIPVEEWDKKIENGLHDVNVLFTGLYSQKMDADNKPGIRLSPTPDDLTGKDIYTDIKTRMTKMADNFSLLQGEFEKIKEDFTSTGANTVAVYKNDIEEINKLLKVLEQNQRSALACIDQSVRGPSGDLLTILLTGGGSLLGFIPGFAVLGPLGIFGGAIIGGYFSRKARKKARKKANKAAKRCADSATRYNKAAIELSNKFICGGL